MRSTIWKTTALPLAAAALAASGVRAQTPGENSPVAVVAAAKSPAAARGGKGAIAITLTIKPGYHINAADPGNPDLIPATVTGQAEPGIAFGKPVFPAAKTITADGKPIRVYTGKAVLTLPFTVAPSARPGKHTLAATVGYQSCNATLCLPPADAPVHVVVTVK